MLASITPLGERGRGSSWPATASALALSATLAGAGAGAAVGALGALAGLTPGTRAHALEAVLVLALLLDLGVGPLRVPSVHRQVNEDWLGRYRGWVCGVGFGGQLGVGLATMVTSAAVYAAAAAAALCASALAGMCIGAVFGGVRGASLLLARRVRSPAELLVLHRRLERAERGARRAAVAAECLLVLLVAAWL